MSFTLSEEHEELRSAVRRFAEDEIAPNAAETEERAEYPWKSFEAYRNSGFIRIPFPEEYGGDGADTLAYALLVEEIARVCASSSLFVLITRLASEPLINHGSEELKARYLTRFATGEYQGSYCLSEPNAGSDVAALRARAVRDGDSYILNGRKSWVTNAGVSDVYMVFARTDPDAGSRGISVFAVEKSTPGFSVAKLESKLGVRGSPTGELLLEDVRVPAANLIGDENRGFVYAMEALDASRAIIGAQAVGIAQGALEVAGRYALERRAFGHPIAEFQGLQFMLADMATQIDAARLLVYRACELLDAGVPGTSKASSMAKVFASDTAMAVTTNAVQILGGAGYVKDFPAERMMRDAKITQIYEGTNQIQRVVIARRLLEELSAHG